MNKKKELVQIIFIVLFALTVATALILLSGASPAEAYAMFFRGIFGSKAGFLEIFVKATPLIFTGLGCAVAFRSGFFNIGAEGQFYMGAVAATAVSLGLPGLPGVLRIVLSFVAAFAAGGMWSLIAAIVKSRFRISEIIVTIMLNYIAINFVGIAVRTFLMDPAGSVPQSAKIESVLPLLLPPSRLNAGFLIAVAAVAITWFLLEKTTLGFEIKAVGLNKQAASCNGISAARSIIIAAIVSGGLAGLAGATEVLGIQKKLLEGISANCGYNAVLIALLSSNNPLGVFGASTGFAALQVGANSMQRQLGIPSAIVNILVGLAVILIMSKDLFCRKPAVVINKKAILKEEGKC
ncbi:MAG: ABC transporter permease [Sedimentibacter sp.]|uniref:ABC transporter permease n=1 Tax=Sedimentibacter sp. TaxID=1960295 RepID=UPI0031591D11